LSGRDDVVGELRAYRGLLGGILKAVAGVYLVFFTGLFSGVASVLQAASEALTPETISSLAQLEAFLEATVASLWSTLGGDALRIGAGLTLWAAAPSSSPGSGGGYSSLCGATVEREKSCS
jgi:hypothetical protein